MSFGTSKIAGLDIWPVIFCDALAPGAEGVLAFLDASKRDKTPSERESIPNLFSSIYIVFLFL